MEHSAADLKSLLTKIQLKDLTAKQTKTLVALGHGVTIGTVLETLSEHGLLSAPIFIADEEGNINPSLKTLIGFVDTWTVLAAFLQSLGGSASPTVVPDCVCLGPNQPQQSTSGQVLNRWSAQAASSVSISTILPYWRWYTVPHKPYWASTLTYSCTQLPDPLLQTLHLLVLLLLVTRRQQ